MIAKLVVTTDRWKGSPVNLTSAMANGSIRAATAASDC
jgi:hypothetical protein